MHVSSSPPPCAPASLANVAVECCEESLPGFTNFERNGPHNPTNKTPAVTATTLIVSSFRFERRLRTGTHLVTGRQHVPSGIGPYSHGPPYSAGRVHL